MVINTDSELIYAEIRKEDSQELLGKIRNGLLFWPKNGFQFQILNGRRYSRMTVGCSRQKTDFSLNQKRWSCRKPESYTSINWTKKLSQIPRDLSKNQCFTSSSTNFTLKDGKTSGTLDADFETDVNSAIDKNVIGREYDVQSVFFRSKTLEDP